MAMMLIDKYLPVFHFAEKHSIAVNAARETIFGLVEKLDVSKSAIIRFLFWLRGMKGTKHREDFLRDGFIELERSDDELVIGLIGQFWRPSGNLQKFSPAEFVSYVKPKFVKGVWNFKLNDKEGRCEVVTETRLFCTDETSRKRFSLYWILIKPFSGLIRMEMLRQIKREAESLTHEALEPNR